MSSPTIVILYAFANVISTGFPAMNSVPLAEPALVVLSGALVGEVGPLTVVLDF
jgi:hypothetical protein